MCVCVCVCVCLPPLSLPLSLSLCVSLCLSLSVSLSLSLSLVQSTWRLKVSEVSLKGNDSEQSDKTGGRMNDASRLRVLLIG